MQSTLPSLNKLTEPLVINLVENAESLRIAVSRLENGTQIIDAGISVPGSIEAGRQISEICMGGLGQVRLEDCTSYANTNLMVHVESKEPVLACLASQYAGWSLDNGEGKEAFNALGSGPARAMGSNEVLFEELSYKDNAETAYLVVEVDKLPPVELADMIATRCGISPDMLTLVLTPTTSVCGVIQVVARVLETSLHKVHTLGFPLESIIEGKGCAPVCPVADDLITGMGRINDAILFAGDIQLQIDAEDDELESLANKLPSCTSSDYGKLFAEVFKEVNYDFYKIDPMLFSPAKVAITSVTTGKTYEAGKIDKALLEKSFTS